MWPGYLKTKTCKKQVLLDSCYFWSTHKDGILRTGTHNHKYKSNSRNFNKNDRQVLRPTWLHCYPSEIIIYLKVLNLFLLLLQRELTTRYRFLPKNKKSKPKIKTLTLNLIYKHNAGWSKITWYDSFFLQNFHITTLGMQVLLWAILGNCLATPREGLTNTIGNFDLNLRLKTRMQTYYVT